MASPTVVIENCDPKTANPEVHSQIAGMLAKLPDIDGRLSRAKRIFIKLNLGIRGSRLYMERPIDYTDPAVFEGLANFLQSRTKAEILVGDGTDSMMPEEAARQRGHMAVVEKYGYQFVDLNQPPFSRFWVPKPKMFRWYELSSALKGVDLWISVAKMKSHHLCGVTLTMKNLFGLPPNQVYGEPRGALHSSVRLPRILTDLTQICAPSIGLIDGIIGANYSEWGGDPVSSGILIAGDNLVATDAVGARFMGADPQASFGIPPFIRAENHIKLAHDEGLGPLDLSDMVIIGNMPVERKPFSVIGGTEPDVFSQMARNQIEVRKNAKCFLDDRENFVKEYLDELIFIGKGKVFFHEKISENSTANAFQALDAQKLGIYEVYAKLVKAEEAELFEVYDLG